HQADLGLGPQPTAAVELAEVAVLLGVPKTPLDHLAPQLPQLLRLRRGHLQAVGRQQLLPLGAYHGSPLARVLHALARQGALLAMNRRALVLMDHHRFPVTPWLALLFGMRHGMTLGTTIGLFLGIPSELVFAYEGLTLGLSALPVLGAVWAQSRFFVLGLVLFLRVILFIRVIILMYWS